MPSQRAPSDVDEGPQDSDLQRFGGDTRPCPSCKTEVYDEAEWCHACGHVMSSTDEARLPPWVVITAVGVAAAFTLFLIIR